MIFISLKSDDPPCRDRDPPPEKVAPSTPTDNPRHSEPARRVAAGMEETSLGDDGVEALDPTFADLI